ncbi:tail assembly protein, partial [Escherichia coli EC1846]
LCATSDRTAL